MSYVSILACGRFFRSVGNAFFKMGKKADVPDGEFIAAGQWCDDFRPIHYNICVCAADLCVSATDICGGA